MHDQERILVIKLSALGDFFIAMGAMEAIRKHHKNAHITLLTTRPFVDIAQRSGWFDEVWTDFRPKLWQPLRWLGLRHQLNAGGFSRVYDLQGNDRTRLYHRLFKNKPEWSGVIAGTSLYCDDVDKKTQHAFDRHRRILSVAGLEVHRPDISWMKSDVSLFDLPSTYILMVPGSAPQHPHKRWPAVRYSALALRLARQGYNVVLLGAEAERDTIETIRRAAPETIDLCGRTSLFDIASLARNAVAAIGNDTGPMHVISLTGCPSLVLFSGVTNPELSAPVGAAVRALQADNIEDITVEDVMEQIHPRSVA